MDDSLIYSSSALDILSDFHEVETIIYVEGITDVGFWNTILTHLNISGYLLKPAGGREEVNKYIEDIIERDASIIAIRDSDYDSIRKKTYKHDRIIYTPGYSYENSILSPTLVNRIIEIKSRHPGWHSEDYDSWRVREFSKLERLLALEILYEDKNIGKVVIGKDYNSLALRGERCKICEDTVNTKVEALSQIIDSVDHTAFLRRVKKMKNPIYKIMRGHFYVRAVSEYIRFKLNIASQHKKHTTMPIDELMDIAVALIDSKYIQIDDIDEITLSINTALESLRKVA